MFLEHTDCVMDSKYEIKTGVDGKQYKVSDDTWYYIDTPDPVVAQLEWARAHEVRLRLRLGDAKTGEDWLKENNCEGRVGRSTGPIKIPLLIHNSRSHGGGAILTHCIVRILRTSDWARLWSHPNYQTPVFTKGEWQGSKYAPEAQYPWRVFQGVECVAGFKTEAQASRWIVKMSR